MIEDRVLIKVRLLPNSEQLLPARPDDSIEEMLSRVAEGLTLARVERDGQGRYLGMELQDSSKTVSELPRDAEWWVVDPEIKVTIFMNEYARTVMGQPRMMLQFYLDEPMTVRELVTVLKDACGLQANDDRFWLMGNFGTHVEELHGDASVATLNQSDTPIARFWQFQVLLERENPLQLGIQRQGWLLMEKQETMATMRRVWTVLQGTSLFGYADRHFRIGETPIIRLDDLDCAKISYKRPEKSRHRKIILVWEFELRMADGSVWSAWTTSQASAERWVRCLRNATRSPEIVQLVTAADVDRIERAKSQLIPVEQILAGLTNRPTAAAEEEEAERTDEEEAQLLDRLADGRTGWAKREEAPPTPKPTHRRDISLSDRLKSDRQHRLDRLQSLEGLVMFNGMDDVELLRDWFECCRTILLEWLEHGLLATSEMLAQVEKQLLLPLQEWRLRLEGRMSDPSLSISEFTTLLRRISLDLEQHADEEVAEVDTNGQTRFRQELIMMKLCRFTSLSDLDAVVNQAEVCRRRRVNPLRRLTRRLSKLKLGKQSHRTEVTLPERTDPLPEEAFEVEPVKERIRTPSDVTLLSPMGLSEVILSDSGSIIRSGGLASPA